MGTKAKANNTAIFIGYTPLIIGIVSFASIGNYPIIKSGVKAILYNKM